MTGDFIDEKTLRRMYEDHGGIKLDYETDAGIDIGYVGDFYALLRAIDEVVPRGSVMYAEGQPADEIRAFLMEHGASVRQRVWRGTFFPEPECFHLAIERDNLTRFRKIADKYAEPEIAYHLVVYDADGVLVSAYDAGDDNVGLSARLGEAAIQQFKIIAEAVKGE